MITTKVPLRFISGKFRILVLTDLHYRPNEDGKTIAAVKQMIGKTNPDFVFFCGDITAGRSEKEEFERLLSDIVTPIEEKNIPWAHVFGNHDQSPGLEKPYQERVFESYPHCVSMAGPEELPGVGNYYLPILGKDNKAKFLLWALDSMQDYQYQSDPVAYNFNPYFDLLMPSRIMSRSDSDYVRFEQVMWYYTESQKLEREEACKIPSIMLLHIPLYEFNAILQNPDRTVMKGEYNETVSCSEVNSGLFAAVLQRGDVKGIYCGHDHTNTFEGTYCGIRMGFCGSCGYACYGLKDFDPRGGKNRLRGGRVIEISEDNPNAYTSEMVFADEAEL